MHQKCIGDTGIADALALFAVHRQVRANTTPSSNVKK
jgi:hypothetical protein